MRRRAGSTVERGRVRWERDDEGATGRPDLEAGRLASLARHAAPRPDGLTRRLHLGLPSRTELERAPVAATGAYRVLGGRGRTRRRDRDRRGGQRPSGGTGARRVDLGRPRPPQPRGSGPCWTPWSRSPVGPGVPICGCGCWRTTCSPGTCTPVWASPGPVNAGRPTLAAANASNGACGSSCDDHRPRRHRTGVQVVMANRFIASAVLPTVLDPWSIWLHRMMSRCQASRKATQCCGVMDGVSPS